MDDIKSNLQEIKEYTMDRLKMPIFFYYFVILVVWNWDIILLILKSEASIEIIIEKIKGNHFEPSRYLWPLAIAIGGNIVFPLVMYGIDYPLSWINKGRNKKASEVELDKAKSEHKIQQERTGAITLTALQAQIDSAENLKMSLSKSLKESADKLNEKEDLLKLKNIEILDVKSEIIELNKYIESLISSVGYSNLDEEIESFRSIVKEYIDNSISMNDVLYLVRKGFMDENNLNMLVLEDTIGFSSILDKIFIENTDGENTIVQLTPYGIKFMYWLEGVLDKDNFENEIPENKKRLNESSDKKLYIEKIYSKFKELNLVQDFQKDMLKVKSGTPFARNNASINEYLKYNLIVLKSSGVGGSRIYTLTPIGESLFEYVVQKEL